MFKEKHLIFQERHDAPKPQTESAKIEIDSSKVRSELLDNPSEDLAKITPDLILTEIFDKQLDNVMAGFKAQYNVLKQEIASMLQDSYEFKGLDTSKNDISLVFTGGGRKMISLTEIFGKNIDKFVDKTLLAQANKREADIVAVKADPSKMALSVERQVEIAATRFIVDFLQAKFPNRSVDQLLKSDLIKGEIMRVLESGIKTGYPYILKPFDTGVVLDSTNPKLPPLIFSFSQFDENLNYHSNKKPTTKPKDKPDTRPEMSLETLVEKYLTPYLLEMRPKMTEKTVKDSYLYNQKVLPILKAGHPDGKPYDFYPTADGFLLKPRNNGGEDIKFNLNDYDDYLKPKAGVPMKKGKSDQTNEGEKKDFTKEDLKNALEKGKFDVLGLPKDDPDAAKNGGKKNMEVDEEEAGLLKDVRFEKKAQEIKEGIFAKEYEAAKYKEDGNNNMDTKTGKEHLDSMKKKNEGVEPFVKFIKDYLDYLQDQFKSRANSITTHELYQLRNQVREDISTYANNLMKEAMENGDSETYAAINICDNISSKVLSDMIDTYMPLAEANDSNNPDQ